jgi:hypothetical protein
MVEQFGNGIYLYVEKKRIWCNIVILYYTCASSFRTHVPLFNKIWNVLLQVFRFVTPSVVFAPVKESKKGCPARRWVYLSQRTIIEIPFKDISSGVLNYRPFSRIHLENRFVLKWCNDSNETLKLYKIINF